MKYAFIVEKQVAFPVVGRCRVLGVSRSGSYDFLDAPEAERGHRDSVLTVRTRVVFAVHKGWYGSPRVC